MHAPEKPRIRKDKQSAVEQPRYRENQITETCRSVLPVGFVASKATSHVRWCVQTKAEVERCERGRGGRGSATLGAHSNCGLVSSADAGSREGWGNRKRHRHCCLVCAGKKVRAICGVGDFYRAYLFRTTTTATATAQ